MDEIQMERINQIYEIIDSTIRANNKVWDSNENYAVTADKVITNYSFALGQIAGLITSIKIHERKL